MLIESNCNKSICNSIVCNIWISYALSYCLPCMMDEHLFMLTVMSDSRSRALLMMFTVACYFVKHSFEMWTCIDSLPSCIHKQKQKQKIEHCKRKFALFSTHTLDSKIHFAVNDFLSLFWISTFPFRSELHFLKLTEFCCFIFIVIISDFYLVSSIRSLGSMRRTFYERNFPEWKQEQKKTLTHTNFS